MEGPPSDALKINRQPSKKVIFPRQPSKLQIKIDGKKVISDLAISADLPGIMTPEKSVN